MNTLHPPCQLLGFQSVPSSIHPFDRSPHSPSVVCPCLVTNPSLAKAPPDKVTDPSTSIVPLTYFEVKVLPATRITGRFHEMGTGEREKFETEGIRCSDGWLEVGGNTSGVRKMLRGKLVLLNQGIISRNEKKPLWQDSMAIPYSSLSRPCSQPVLGMKGEIRSGSMFLPPEESQESASPTPFHVRIIVSCLWHLPCVRGQSSIFGISVSLVTCSHQCFLSFP